MFIISLVEDGALTKTSVMSDIELTTEQAKKWFNEATKRGKDGAVNIHFQIEVDQVAKQCVKASLDNQADAGLIEIFSEVEFKETKTFQTKERVIEVAKHLFLSSLEFVLFQIAESLAAKTKASFR